ncbi:MAG: hypothetical protein WCP30_00030 [Mycobacteriaceae bacterium]
MPWLMVYITVAVAVLSVAGACCAKGLRHDPGRLVAIIAAAALWPVVVVGLVQFGAIHLYANSLRRRTCTPVDRAPLEPEPATAPMVLVDSLVRMAQQVGAKHPA